MLAELTGTLSRQVGIILGDESRRSFVTEEYFDYYRWIKGNFVNFIAKFPGDGPPLPVPGADHGVWASHAAAHLEAVDHLSRVANITRSQIVKLERGGIATMTDLVRSTTDCVLGISPEVFGRMKEQAVLQSESKCKQSPSYKVLEPPADNLALGMAALPPPSPMDVYFDMEGFPGEDQWLEYLFGAVVLEQGKPVFLDWWAHDERSEKRAFEAFVDWVYKRWQNDPSMHIYHYAAYEVTAMKRLMTTYATRENEVDQLLRNRVFVDLYAIVRHGVRVGEPAYSLKNLEHLYMQRSGDVTDAGASVVYYERWRGSGEPMDWNRSPILRAIRDYNKDDCVSTWKLAQWLCEQQSRHGIKFLSHDQSGRKETEQVAVPPKIRKREELSEALLAGIPDDAQERSKHADAWRVQELLAWLVGFHRREDKPMWWRLFERLSSTAEELSADLDCLGQLRRVGDGEKIQRSKRFEYAFDPTQDTKLHEGSSVKMVPDEYGVLKIGSFDPNGRLSLTISDAKMVAGGNPPTFASLIPYEHINAGAIEEAIYGIANEWAERRELPQCLHDYLFRARPRLKNAPSSGPLIEKNESTLQAATRIANAMDSTCLCIQGPPGTGKTYTAARMIRSLLRAGKKVGVTSNSHKAICNLMAAVCEITGPEHEVIKVGGEPAEPLLEPYPWIDFEKSSTSLEAAGIKGLVGGTAWLFSREEMIGLDYLFVDEAGQVSVANLVGVSRSSENLVLMGDQMQLGQPIQGAHPGESGLSALDYYLHGHATIPDDMGLFLGTTYRMHPAVCRFISDAVYESRLAPAPETAHRIVKVPRSGGDVICQDAGIVAVPVAHEGNTQGSDEEVAMICRITHELLGREHTGKDGHVIGRLTVEDILYVAPYNLQVRRLIENLPAGARVGSVDKFQGQEAPVVIISMCASPGEFGQRGMEFVLDKNRLNVAISRAQSISIIVGDPRLINSPVNSVENMQRVSLLARAHRSVSSREAGTGDRWQ